jgi:hypothetical protein
MQKEAKARILIVLAPRQEQVVELFNGSKFASDLVQLCI